MRASCMLTHHSKLGITDRSDVCFGRARGRAAFAFFLNFDAGNGPSMVVRRERVANPETSGIVILNP